MIYFLEYVIKAETLRRHLTTSQRAMLAVELEPVFAKEAKKRQREAGEKYGRGKEKKVRADLSEAIEHEQRSDTQVGKVFGVSQSTVARAKKIANTKPEKAKEIRSGKTTIDAVYRKIRQEEAENEARGDKGNIQSKTKHSLKYLFAS